MCSSVRNNKTRVLGQLPAHAGPADRSHLERPASQFMQLGWGDFSERISHYTFDRKLGFVTQVPVYTILKHFSILNLV